MVPCIKFPHHNYGGEILCPPPPVRYMVRVRVRVRVRVMVGVGVGVRFMYFQRPYIKFPLHSEEKFYVLPKTPHKISPP